MLHNKLSSRLLIIALLTMAITGILCTNTFCQTYPSAYIDKVSTTPDLLQTDRKANFTDNGVHYSGPVSASNIFVWLANNGFARLCTPAESQKQSQIAMVHKLALPAYMATSDAGSSPTEVMRGIKKYVSDAGYRCVRMEYQGWRSISKKFSVQSDIPQLEWMQEIISNPAGGLCINVGFYTYSKESHTFTRIGGHWVTAVGYGVDAKGNPDPYTIIIHDPSRRDGKSTHHDYCRLWPINDGSILSGAKGLPISANGYYTIPSLNIPKTSDIAVLDCAVGFVVGK